MKTLKLLSTLLILLSYPGIGNAQPPSQLSKVYTSESPQVLAPGLISTLQGEYSATYDSSRDELYFMRRTPGVFDYTIYTSRLTKKGWTTPAVVSFSGKYRDAAPYLSPDGNTLFFDSKRPSPEVAPNSINIWYSKRTKKGWGKPEFLVAPSINSEDEPVVGQDEFGPAVDAKGTLYFYSFREPYRGGAHYTSTPPNYKTIRLNTALPDPSSRTFVSYLYISPDGKLALLEGRATDRRDTDIFCSCKTQDGSWTTPMALPMINTRANEGGPSLTTDGKYILFTSNRASGNSSALNANLYIAKATSFIANCRAKAEK
ncbi:PD40 domain-containing protein [Muriicola soli]|nr:PD40 domain-containing protein [Muriicola soli]